LWGTDAGYSSFLVIFLMLHFSHINFAFEFITFLIRFAFVGIRLTFGNILGVDLGRHFVVFILSLFILRTIQNLLQQKSKNKYQTQRHQRILNQLIQNLRFVKRGRKTSM
jgi:hypothetical protein